MVIFYSCFVNPSAEVQILSPPPVKMIDFSIDLRLSEQ